MHRRLTRHLLSHSNRGFAEKHNVVRGSRSQGQRNFGVAVTVSSDASESKKSHKRVSKDERRSMVESFVNKYRAMNSGNFPTFHTVHKEVGGSYYVIRDIVQELQHKSRMPSTSAVNDTIRDAKLHKDADVTLGTAVTIKKAELTTKDEDGSNSCLEEKTLSDESASATMPTITSETTVSSATMHTMTSETTLSLKENKLANQEEDGSTFTPDEKTLSGKITTTTLGARVEVKVVEVKVVELAAQKVDEPISPLDYNAFSEEIAKPSVIDDSSVETAGKRDLLKEEARHSHSTTRISEDNTREQTGSKVDQQQQSSELEDVTRDLPAVHEKKQFTWNLKSLAEGFMKMWRKL